MNTRERFRAVMNFEPFDRLPILEWAPWWDKTRARWNAEGAPAQLGTYELQEHLGMDIYLQGWFSPGGGYDTSVLGSIRTAADYDAIRDTLFSAGALNDFTKRVWTEWSEQQAAGEVVLWLTLDGYFWWPRSLMGIEEHLYAFYDQPELMHRINEDLCQWQLGLAEEFRAFGIEVDYITIAEDMSYKHGPMLSHEMFEEFLAPYYRQVIPAVKQGNEAFVLVDTDGEASAMLPWLASVGVDGMLPLERRAGMDLAEIRRDFPEMRFIGHYDKTVMHLGWEAMAAEFERLLPIARQGGFIISVDHQTPPDVSYEMYQTYLELFAHYAALAAKGE